MFKSPKELISYIINNLDNIIGIECTTDLTTDNKYFAIWWAKEKDLYNYLHFCEFSDEYINKLQNIIKYVNAEMPIKFNHSYADQAKIYFDTLDGGAGLNLSTDLNSIIEYKKYKAPVLGIQIKEVDGIETTIYKGVPYKKYFPDIDNATEFIRIAESTKNRRYILILTPFLEILFSRIKDHLEESIKGLSWKY